MQLRIIPSIGDALRDARPIVALETSVFAQGLPIPENREAARRMVEAIEQRAAVPALTGVVGGTAAIGLQQNELERFLNRTGVRKVSARDLPLVMAAGADGATTVAAALALARLAGISVFATGGIGGVHGEPAFDESADLYELATTPMVVVCAGAKSILNLPATCERLESLGIPVVGYRTEEFPGFFCASTGLPVSALADTVDAIAAIWRAHRALGRSQALLVVQPPPPSHALARSDVDRAVAAARREAQLEGVRAADLTPFLLEAITRLTGGSSLKANIALLEQNAALAADVAAMLSAERGPHDRGRSSAVQL